MLTGTSKYLLVFLCVTLLNYSNCSSGSTDSANVETLKLAQVLFRHGARSPINEYPTDPYGNLKKYWPDGLGQLTTVGMMQQFKLGEYIGFRYASFLSKTYNREEVFVQSSNIDRTIMSAEANLAGLFPPTSQKMWNPNMKWQPIPVHTIPGQYDNKIDFSIKCPRYAQEFKMVTESGYIADIVQKNQWLMDHLTKHTGRSIKTVEHIGELYDTFFVQSQNNLKLPAFATDVFPGSLKPLAELHFRTIAFNEEMQKLRGGPLLKDMIWHMDLQKMDVSTVNIHLQPEYRQAKLYMYSGHDSTIASLLIALGVYNDIIPPYASAVIVELHSNKSYSNDDFIKIFYRNDTQLPAYELEVPDCPGPCTVYRLKQLKSHIMVDDWESQCESVLPSQNHQVSVTAMLSFLAIMAILILAFQRYCKRRSKHRRGIITIDIRDSKIV